MKPKQKRFFGCILVGIATVCCVLMSGVFVYLYPAALFPVISGWLVIAIGLMLGFGITLCSSPDN